MRCARLGRIHYILRLKQVYFTVYFMRILNNAQTVTKLNFGWTGAREYTHEYGHEYSVPESKKIYS